MTNSVQSRLDELEHQVHGILAEIEKLKLLASRDKRGATRRWVENSTEKLAAEFGYTRHAVRKGKAHPLPRIRSVLTYRLRETGRSWPAVAALLGLHHTTAIHACNKIFLSLTDETRERLLSIVPPAPIEEI